MATKTFYFSGTANWAKVYEPVEAYDKTKPKEFTIQVELDEKSYDLFRQSGSQLRPKKGTEREFTFRCPSTALIKGEVAHFAPKVVDKNNEDFNEKIGNGSKVDIKVEVYDTRMGKGTRLSGVRVVEYIPYDEAGYEGEVDSPF